MGGSVDPGQKARVQGALGARVSARQPSSGVQAAGTCPGCGDGPRTVLGRAEPGRAHPADSRTRARGLTKHRKHPKDLKPKAIYFKKQEK